MTDASQAPRLETGPDGGRFVLGSGAEEAELSFRTRGGVMEITHTYTPPAARGGGVASQLMRAAVAHARQQGLKIAPLCSYADGWMRRHPEQQDLLSAQ